jgi:hypothetical protein
VRLFVLIPACLPITGKFLAVDHSRLWRLFVVALGAM